MVLRLTPKHLQEYKPDHICGFGTDPAKFDKITPALFDRKGDVYFRATGRGPASTAPTTHQVRKGYEFLFNRFVPPAMKLSQSRDTGSHCDILAAANPRQ